MSKLSPTLKAAINASHARPGTLAAPKHISSVYEGIARDASSHNVGLAPWLTIATATTMTMNSPESLIALHKTATAGKTDAEALRSAELMREVGLKCISFNGIPRSINCLGAFYASLASSLTSQLSTAPTRTPTPENLAVITARGRELWDSIYAPFERKLYDKLAQSHPDLPVHILNSHYGPLLADPPTSVPGAKVGRVLTSLVAVSCLRAQTGVALQVTSHFFGLRKAFEDGTAYAEGEENVPGGEWLASDEGNLWVLKIVDGIVESLSGGKGTTFVPGLKAKL